MLIIPAIDLMGGRCVRLVEGRAETATTVGEDPVAVARRFVAEGAERLHVVDLDGALAGSPRQGAAIAALAAAIPVPIQVGGGLRDLAAVEAALVTGAHWVILGTSAALEPTLLEAVGARWPGRLLVAVDAVDGWVAVRGWTTTVPLLAVDLARRARAAGAAAVVYTDVRRDGTGRGPNLEAVAALAADATVPVLASGGIAGMEDLVQLAGIPGVAGAIVGRALYTGAVDLRAARAVVGPRGMPCWPAG
jgi:phosphoribosylformimino-5-aminoimidazole carboxamide ribotide isomerase